MANNTGIRELPNGNYEVRIVINRKDIKVNTIRRSDDNGNPFKTKKEARDFRDTFVQNAKSHKVEIKPKDCTLREVYEKYMDEGTIDKAPATIRKQQSMWENHISHEFGDRYISQITLQDLKNYLAKMYRYGDGRGKEQSYSYKYVEGFLKFFYLLWACAYNDNYIDNDIYTKMFIDKKTRLSMPKKTQQDNDDEKNIKCFTPLEIEKMNIVFQGTNFHLPFILGYMTGVRVSECFGLMWSDVNWNEGTITVERQLLYEDGCFVLRPVKTLESSRTVYMNDTLQDFLFNYRKQQDENRKKLGHGYRATEKVLDRTIVGTEKVIVGGDFINRKENGELMTSNSVKYWARVLKDLGIDFKYHSLRKSFGTYHAAANTPAIELKNAMGHKKFETTLKYYVNQNQITKEKLIANLGILTNVFSDGSITITEERKKELISKGILTKQEFVMPNVPIPSEKTVLSMFPNMEEEVADIMERIKNLNDSSEEETPEETAFDE